MWPGPSVEHSGMARLPPAAGGVQAVHWHSGNRPILSATAIPPWGLHGVLLLTVRRLRVSHLNPVGPKSAVWTILIADCYKEDKY